MRNASEMTYFASSGTQNHKSTNVASVGSVGSGLIIDLVYLDTYDWGWWRWALRSPDGVAHSQMVSVSVFRIVRSTPPREAT